MDILCGIAPVLDKEFLHCLSMLFRPDIGHLAASDVIGDHVIWFLHGATL
jgi:hypothetical protein